jgi:hypothetical protein
MADLTITASAVVPGTGAIISYGIAGVTITQGQPVYVDTSTNTIKLADANSTAATETVAGISVSSALAGQPVGYQTAGTLAFGAILTAGKVYVNSGNAGLIAPIADLTSGWVTSILGYATTTSNLTVNIINTAVTN